MSKKEYKNVKFSIVVPVYNEDVKIVENTVNAIKDNQKKINLDNIILVDDGSDKTEDFNIFENQKGIILKKS